MKGLIKNYFLNGFSLANRSLDIFLVLLLLSLVGFIPSFLGESTFGKMLSYVTLPIVLIQLSFWVSLPLFLADKQQNKPINYRDLLTVTFRNAKRLIIPEIILAILFAILALVFVFVAGWNVTKSGGGPNQIAPYMQNVIQNLLRWNPIMFIFTGIFSLFVFTTIYFSLENKGFFGSVKKSVIFGFKNLSYVVLVFLIYAIYYSVLSLFPLTFKVPASAQTNLGLLIRGIVGSYVFFIILASSLLYYQSKNR